MTNTHRVIEALSSDAGYYFDNAVLLEAGQSQFQRYEIWQLPRFGRFLRLDEAAMLSEGDECIYHESLVHVPALAHPDPRRALVLGGGDGGAIEELLKYPSMERVVMVELDPTVVELARRHFPDLHRGAFDDPRVELRFQDGMVYVREVAPTIGARFDLIFLDLTDPWSGAEALFGASFLQDCKALLTPLGAVVAHIGSPHHRPDEVRAVLQDMRQVFRIVYLHFHYIPTFGSSWGLAVAADALDCASLSSEEVDRRIQARGLRDLQHINGDVYRAAGALSPYLRQLLGVKS